MTHLNRREVVMHRMGKPKKDEHGSHTIITHFLRFPDRERVFKCGRKLKGTDYKMYEDIPKELHELRKSNWTNSRKLGRTENVHSLVKLSRISYTLMGNMLNCNFLLICAIIL